jgi:hypothetical protein
MTEKVAAATDEESAVGGFKEKQIPRYARDDRVVGALGVLG